MRIVMSIIITPSKLTNEIARLSLRYKIFFCALYNMKIQLLIIFTFLNISSLMMIQGAEEEPKRGTVQFYEILYKTKINGVKPIGEYSDPDQFFAAIARQVGIPKLAFEAVEKNLDGKPQKMFFSMPS